MTERQELILRTIYDYPGITITEILDMYWPDLTYWERNNVKGYIRKTCRVLHKYGLIRVESRGKGYISKLYAVVS